ncbi:MAG: hypothetical protein OEY33_03555 [Bdellovibrionales bacterium]|nr:hypothetical protein [Bdellovibrionales bacterium]
MIILWALFLNLVYAQQKCGPDLIHVRDHAHINYLDRGAYIKFNKSVDLPSFNDKVLLKKGISIHYPAQSEDDVIKSGSHYRINLVNALENGYQILLSDSFPIIIKNKIETVGDLKKELGAVISVCKKPI